VMLGCVLVVFGGLVMVLDACVVAHVWLSRFVNLKHEAGLSGPPDNRLTVSRQLCYPGHDFSKSWE
jgi:hypothetical protein